MAGYGTNRTSIELPAQISNVIVQKTQESSAIMQMARQITLPGRGLTFPVITSDPTAEWVGETEAKPVSNPEMATKTMQAYKLAVIVPFSDEFRRDNGALYDALVARLPGALSYQFDRTVIGAVPAPGENFDTFADITAQTLVGGDGAAYKGLVAAYSDIANAGGALNGFVLSPAAKGILLNALDGAGRPLFINNVGESAVPMLLGARTVESRGAFKSGASDSTPDVVGIAGDWTQAVYGTVEGVKVSVSDQATLNISGQQVNLWQNNMFAVRAEIEVGFRANLAMFNKLTGNTSVAG